MAARMLLLLLLALCAAVCSAVNPAFTPHRRGPFHTIQEDDQNTRPAPFSSGINNKNMPPPLDPRLPPQFRPSNGQLQNPALSRPHPAVNGGGGGSVNQPRPMPADLPQEYPVQLPLDVPLAPFSPVPVVDPSMRVAEPLPATSAWSFAQLPPAPYKGYVYFTWGAGSYSSQQSAASLKALADTGVQVVEIGVTWYGENENSTLVAADPQMSPTLADMRSVIQQAQALNLSIVLKPHVDLKNSAWRANIGAFFSEQQWGDWWVSYNAYMDWVFDLATQNNVDAINIGTELCATEHRDHEWRSLVARLRQKGWRKPLWYGTNWNWATPCPSQPHGCPGGPFNITWWDAVDAIGVDAYFPLAKTPGGSVADLVQSWHQIMAPLLDLSQRFQRPLIFPEIGYASFADATTQPWACCSGSPDTEAQRTAFAAFFQGPWAAKQVQGVFWWAWSPSDVPISSCNTNFAIFGKPAEDVVAQAYGGRGSSVKCT